MTMHTRVSLPMLCVAIGAITAFTDPAMADNPECTAAAMRAAAPVGMLIGDIPDVGAREIPKTTQGVVDVPDNSLGDGAPEYCFVTGSVTTNPATRKTAHFAAALPVRTQWNGKFMFIGCGGNCGTAFLALPSAAALRKGYPLFATDDGHVAKSAPAERLWRFSETSWVVSSSGQRNDDAVTDFFYRVPSAAADSPLPHSFVRSNPRIKGLQVSGASAKIGNINVPSINKAQFLRRYRTTEMTGGLRSSKPAPIGKGRNQVPLAKIRNSGTHPRWESKVPRPVHSVRRICQGLEHRSLRHFVRHQA
jgi:hypothetical protein